LKSKEGAVGIAGYVVVMFKFRKVGRRWTAYCEELGTATFGRSLPEAEKRIKEAVLLHLNTLEEVGERNRFFKEHNIEFHHTKPKKDITVCLPLRAEEFVQPHIQPVPEFSAC
jgi:predicted RNase H-like HicB family nuclease